MRDTELYQRVLGLTEPWSVERVDLDVGGRRVDVWVEHVPGVSWPCPQCQQSLAGYDHAEERIWRHLDTCQFETHLHARIPRVNCPEHGVVNVAVPWAEARSRFTLLMERWIIEVLLEGPHFLRDGPQNELVQRNPLGGRPALRLVLELGGEIQRIAGHGGRPLVRGLRLQAMSYTMCLTTA